MIVVRDEFEARPGKGRALFEAYMAEYVPGARDRGMELVDKIVSPPFWLDDGSNTLLFIWRLPDAASFWRKNHLSRRDPAVTKWWEGVDSLATSRRRDTFADPENFESLADV